MLWLGLGVLALVQTYIATSHQLAVPEFALRQVESKLAAVGLEIEFGEADFDPQGRFLLRDVSIRLAGIKDPAIRADSIFIEVDPVSLVLRSVVPRRVRITGADLLMPAMISPSGIPEPLVRGLDTSLRLNVSGQTLTVDSLTAHFGPVPFDLQGSWALPPASSREPHLPLDELLRSIARNYLRGCELARPWLSRIPPLASPHLSLRLTPHPEHLADLAIDLRAAKIELALARFGPAPLVLTDVSAKTHFALAGRPHLASVRIHGGQVTLPTLGSVSDFQAELDALVALAQLRFEPRLLSATASAITTPDITLSTPSLRASLSTLPQVQAQGFAQVAGEPVAVQTDLDVTTGAGRVTFRARVASELIAITGKRIGFDLPSVIEWQSPPTVIGALNLGPDGQLIRAEADITTGPIVARWVPLDATSAHVTWADQRLVAEGIQLIRGRSQATGSYTMDVPSLDFRFLLRGRLDPPDIAGWFGDWWPNFWRKFDFAAAPPDARVDVNGTWKEKLNTQIFIQADAKNPAMEGVPFDRIRSLLFVRPGWADVLEFTAERPVGIVNGSFSRQWRMPKGIRWTAVEVHASGTSDLAPAPAILGLLGEQIVAPFTLDGPLTLQLDGRAEREDFGQPIHSKFAISGESSASWTFKGFPLQGVKFSAQRLDEVLLIDELEAGLADGQLTGRIETRGSEANARVGFDLNLQRARLGQTLRAVSQWQAAQKDEPPEPPSALQTKLADGVLDLSLSAEGPAENPLGYRGSGSALLQSSQLGEINLLGVLSSLLKRTLLNFSTLQLDSVNGDFELRGNELNFTNLKATGPRGALNATGQYYLDTQELAFLTKVRPFEASQGLLNAVLSPLTNVLEVKLGGILTEPDWTFVYGPTNFLRTLTGENDMNPHVLPPQPASPLPPPSPQSTPVPAPVETDRPAPPPTTGETPSSIPVGPPDSA